MEPQERRQLVTRLLEEATCMQTVLEQAIKPSPQSPKGRKTRGIRSIPRFRLPQASRRAECRTPRPNGPGHYAIRTD